MTSMDQQLDASFCLSLLVLNIQPDLCMSNVIGKRRASLIRKLVWAYFQSQQMLQILMNLNGKWMLLYLYKHKDMADFNLSKLLSI